MNKHWFLIFLIILFSASAFAQQTTKHTVSKGKNLLNIGVGVGNNFFPTEFRTYSPLNPVISYERSISEVISLGVQSSSAVSSSDYLIGGDAIATISTGALYIGGRGSYHFNEALTLNSDKYDVYVGASVGYVLLRQNKDAKTYDTLKNTVGYGAFAGAKYYFAPSFGVYAEAGYQTLSSLTFGFTFKF